MGLIKLKPVGKKQASRNAKKVFKEIQKRLDSKNYPMRLKVLRKYCLLYFTLSAFYLRNLSERQLELNVEILGLSYEAVEAYNFDKNKEDTCNQN